MEEECNHLCWSQDDFSGKFNCQSVECRTAGCHSPNHQQEGELGDFEVGEEQKGEVPKTTTSPSERVEKIVAEIKGRYFITSYEKVDWLTRTLQQLDLEVRGEEFKRIAMGDGLKQLLQEKRDEGRADALKQVLKEVEELRKTKETKLDWAVIGDPDQVLGYIAALDAVISRIKGMNKDV
jgi:hypothetical protein